MAGKIIIRHKGGCFPTLCLLFLLVFVGVVLWLSTAGLPDSALRAIEQAAAKQGVHLHIDKLKLAPGSGIAMEAEGVSLYAEPGGGQAIAKVERAMAELRADALLTGQVELRRLKLNGAHLQLPVTLEGGGDLHLDIHELVARMSAQQVMRLTNADLAMEGCPLRVHGAMDLAPYLGAPQAEPTAESSAPLDLPSLLAQAQPYINETYRVIHSQNWQDGEKPALDVSFDVSQQQLGASLHLALPRYDVGVFHFRNGEAQLDFKDDTVVIHELKFHTIQPDSDLRLQGGYDLNSRQLSFNISSNTAVLRMTEQLVEDEQILALLGKIQHAEADTPEIHLNGHIRFAENYSLEDIHVAGDITQRRLTIGNSMVDSLEISALYDNGNFNVHKCNLTLPEGYLRLTASLRDGKGAAGIEADIDVAKLLSLVSEFTPQPIILPEGVELKGHTRLALNTTLGAPPFVPGQSHWQDFVPHIETAGLNVEVDEASYQGVQLGKPAVKLALSGISQGEDMLPSAIGKTELALQLDKAAWQDKDAGQEAAMGQLHLELQLDDTSLTDLTGDKPQVDVQQGHVSLKAQQLHHGEIGIGSVELTLAADKGFHFPAEPAEILQAADLHAALNDIRHAELDMGNAALQLVMEENKPDCARLHLDMTTPEGETLRLKALPDWADTKHPSLQGVELELPMAAFSPILEHFGISTDAVKMPELLKLRGYADWNTQKETLAESRFHISLPAITRTPTKVKALVGHDVTLAVEADVYLSTSQQGKLGYVVDLEAKQETGEFKGRVTGDADGRIRITGNNTIRADVVDALIDLNDAHDIIRDFQFKADSKNIVTDIDVQVDLTDAGGGVRVDSFCNAELLNVAYMLGGIEVLPDGTERVRTDFGPDPFTLCKHGTCSVLVHVVLDCTDAKGRKVPDECTITLGNAVLDYDNTPWFKRQGFSSGTKETQLTGDSVIIDVEHSFVEINNIRGSVYPAYSIGMFYPPLLDFLSDVLIYTPALVETVQCVFPIYYDCTRPMSGTIRAISAEECGFRFIGTTIPLSNFSGFIYLTDDYVQLDQLNATCWQGVLNAVVNIGFSGKHTTFDGYAAAEAMNLKDIAAAYNNEQKDALCDAYIRFRASSPEVDDVEAYGYINIVDGDLLSLRLFQPVSALISDIPGYFSELEQSAARALGQEKESNIFSWFFKSTSDAVSTVGRQIDSWSNDIPFANHILAYSLQNVYADFTIGGGHLRTERMSATGCNLKIDAELDIDIDKLHIWGNMWPRMSSLPTILLSPITFLSKYLINITLDGPLDNMSWGVGLSPRLKGSEPSATNKRD